MDTISKYTIFIKKINKTLKIVEKCYFNSQIPSKVKLIIISVLSFTKYISITVKIESQRNIKESQTRSKF